jgi:osmoprotectant transport system permease protein
MAGTIDEETMRKLNYRVTEQKLQPSEVARQWIEARYDPTKSLELTSESPQQSARASFFSVAWERRGELAKKSLEHLVLVGLAMGLAILIGVPTGIAIYRYNAASNVVLGLAEIMQTIPSLAMLAFLFAFYSQLGLLPAVSALVLYALLPIVLNTFTGLKEVPQRLIEAADGVGMSQKQRLWMVELPLALPVIIAGIRTSTVWTVGIATLSTYIGAGGLGDFISRGLARSDTTLTLLGALPAAVIALVLSLMIRIIQARLSRG